MELKNALLTYSLCFTRLSTNHRTSDQLKLQNSVMSLVERTVEG